MTETDTSAGSDAADSIDDAHHEERRWHDHRKYLYLLARMVLWGLVLGIIYLCLNAVGNVLFPVVVSVIIAYLFDPLIDWFEERGVNRTLGIFAVLLGGLGFLVGFVLFLYPTIVQQVRHVSEQLPELVNLVETKTIPWIEKTFDYKLPATISEGVEKYGQSITDAMPSVLDKISAWGTQILTSTGAILVALLNLLLIPIFSFYFLRDFDRIRLTLVDYIPPHRRDVVLDRMRKMDAVIGDWVRGQLQVATMLAVMYAIGLGVAFYFAGIEVQAGVAIGILSGLLNFIPYFGVAIGFILAGLMVLINWSGFGGALGVIGVFVVVQMLEGYLITPKVVGDKVGLSPVTVMIVLLVGGEIYGLLGVLLAIPVFGALKVLLPDIIAYYRETSFFTGRDPVTGEAAVETGGADRDGAAGGAAAPAVEEVAGENGDLDGTDGGGEESAEEGDAEGSGNETD